VATLAVCGVHPNPLLFEEAANAFKYLAKNTATKHSIRDVITTSTHELQTLPLAVVNAPADARRRINQLPTAVDPPAISPTQAEIASHLT
jgi:hypothetical protein